MSFYAIGIMGSVEGARLTAKSWGVKLYGVESIGNPDANDTARTVGARASFRYAKKLDRWYKHSGARIKEIDAATPPEALAYLKRLSREKRLSLEEKLFDATREWQSGLLLFYEPVIDTPVRTYAWLAVKRFCGLALGLAGAKRSAAVSPAPGDAEATLINRLRER